MRKGIRVTELKKLVEIKGGAEERVQAGRTAGSTAAHQTLCPTEKGGHGEGRNTGR